MSRIFIHDYAGHPFQIELSRALARRGYTVVHAYCDANPENPKGALAPLADDAAGLEILPIGLPRAVNKGALVDRWWLDWVYGRRLAASVREKQPDVVMLANTPLDVSATVVRECRRSGIPMVYWLQDLNGRISRRVLHQRLGWFGGLVGRYYERMERGLLRASAAVVGITEDFREIVGAMGISNERYTTIPNWAPLAELQPRPKDNAWSQEQGLDEAFVFLYSGSLGFKHNPVLLLGLAKALAAYPDAYLVVNSQGSASEWLKQEACKAGLERVRVNPFQPYEMVSEVLGSADVLVCILEPDAGVFSVPSKVLSYHCAGRPMLLAVPSANLSARIVRDEATGVIVHPNDEVAFVAAAQRLYEDAQARQAMGERARKYAECSFEIDAKADRFETVLEQVMMA